MNLDEYKKFVNNKRAMSRIDAMAILENAAKQNELIHSQKENGENNEQPNDNAILSNLRGANCRGCACRCKITNGYMPRMLGLIHELL